VGTGITIQGLSNNFETIDLESSLSNCKTIQNLPASIEGAVAGLTSSDKPITCGGIGFTSAKKRHRSEDCFVLLGESLQWKPFPALTKPKYGAAVVSSPIPKYSQRLFLTGGGEIDSPVQTVELMTEDGWQSILPKLPVDVRMHCMALVNSTTAIVVGGNQDHQDDSPRTFLFNSKQDHWVGGPPLNYGRRTYSCGRIKNDLDSYAFSVIVAGGYNGSAMSSTEILDVGSNQWRRGPDLPVAIFRAAVVEDSAGGVILVGGAKGNSDEDISNSLYRLPHAG
jgi:hypothetical protein